MNEPQPNINICIVKVMMFLKFFFGGRGGGLQLVVNPPPLTIY